MQDGLDRHADPIPFSNVEIEGSINARFRLVARTVPERVAIDSTTGRLTYAQLEKLSNQIAHLILERAGAAEKSPLAVLIGEGHLAISAIIGILKTNRGAISLPPESTGEHLRQLWDNAGNPLILTTSRNLEVVKALTAQDEAWLVIDDLPADGETAAISMPAPHPADLAIITYTSGSTGEPKGVLWSHRLVLHTACRNQSTYEFAPHDRSAVLASFGYGAAMTQCFAALLSGVGLYMPNVKHANIAALIDWLRLEEISVLAMPPFGLFRQIMDGMAGTPRLSSLRLVILGGDDLTPQDVEHFWTSFGTETQLAYRLAGSETMVIRELFIRPEMRFTSEKIPVGLPVPDKEVLLLDENGQEVLPGEVGEIVVRSSYLASGYWRKPELTGERFKANPSGKGRMLFLMGDLARIDLEGMMVHLGRKDHMVKIRGFSVHLEAVDTALMKLPFVKDALTVAEPLPGGDRRLLAYLVPEKDEKPAVKRIRAALLEVIPEHMLPSVFIWMEALPRTSTGKLDRKALPAPPHTRPELQTPLVPARNEMEQALSRVWMNLLQLDELGVEDNFFELGGDSLLSVRMIIEAERLTDRKVPGTYFALPTIARLAQILQAEGQGEEQVSPALEIGPLPDGSPAPYHRGKKYLSSIRRLLQGKVSPRAALRELQWSISNTLVDMDRRRKHTAIYRLAYPAGCAWVLEWAQKNASAPGPYQQKFRLFERMVMALGGSQGDAQTLFPVSVAGNQLGRLYSDEFPDDVSLKMIEWLRGSPHLFWRSLAEIIDQSSLDQLDQYFSVKGFEHLEKAYQAEGGVILLTYHSCVNRFAITALPRRLDGEIIPTISQKVAKLKGRSRYASREGGLSGNDLSALYAEMALGGRRLLEQGKIIQFVSDIEYDTKGFALALAGRRYHLKTGFAKLVIDSGARVVPQYSVLRPDGTILTTFMPPFAPGDGPREERIAALMHQYEAFINHAWRLAPESLRWPLMNRYFHQPLASPGTE